MDCGWPKRPASDRDLPVGSTESPVLVFPPPERHQVLQRHVLRFLLGGAQWRQVLVQCCTSNLISSCRFEISKRRVREPSHPSVLPWEASRFRPTRMATIVPMRPIKTTVIPPTHFAIPQSLARRYRMASGPTVSRNRSYSTFQRNLTSSVPRSRLLSPAQVSHQRRGAARRSGGSFSQVQ